MWGRRQRTAEGEWQDDGQPEAAKGMGEGGKFAYVRKVCMINEQLPL